MALLAACSALHAKPLPDEREVLERPDPDTPRLRVAIGSLHHPLLPPLDIDLSDGLDPDEAAVLAVLANPDLVAVRDTHGEAAAGLLEAGLLPNPSFTGELDSASGENVGELVPKRVLGLSIDLRSFLTHGSSVAAAEANVASVDLGILWQEWQVAQAARLETTRLGWLRRRLALVRAEIASQTDAARLVESAVASGDLSLPAIGLQRAALESLFAIARTLETTEDASAASLHALLGLAPETPLVVGHPELNATPTMSALADPPSVAECLEQRLDLVALRRGYDAQEARLRQAVLEQLPNVTVGLVDERNESKVHLFGGFLTIGLPIFDRGQARIALAEASRERLRDEFEARVLSIHAETAALAQSIQRFDVQFAEIRASLHGARTLEMAVHDAAEQRDVDRLADQIVRTQRFELEFELESLGQARAEAAVGFETACGGAVHVSTPGAVHS